MAERLNLKDFPDVALRPHKIKAQHPDKFILNLIDRFPVLVQQAAEAHRQSLKNPPNTVAEYLASIEIQGLSESVNALRRLRLLGSRSSE
jgi:hypothetical protein